MVPGSGVFFLLPCCRSPEVAAVPAGPVRLQDPVAQAAQADLDGAPALPAREGQVGLPGGGLGRGRRRREHPQQQQHANHFFRQRGERRGRVSLGKHSWYSPKCLNYCYFWYMKKVLRAFLASCFTDYSATNKKGKSGNAKRNPSASDCPPPRSGFVFHKLPHKDGGDKNVGNPLAKDFLGAVKQVYKGASN